MKKEELYHDFLLIKQMRVSLPRKKRILSELLKEYENFWKVVGITEAALFLLIKNNYKYTKGLNRSHIISRDFYNTEMLSKDWTSQDEWWDYFIKNDKTVISTSTENMSKGEMSQIYPIDEHLQLFPNQGYRFKISKKEIFFLKSISENIIKQ
jgi:hypothetical protein